ncbi:DEAD/DEAH box helicase [Streptococcus zalophi]|uniref:DEAD/DEAH box helicase n=1 Tax=Streptococcus zalophi TaxID=640031 RepID=A0A934UDB3_9STRE|nr:DEAD/DEAH box helicase [Streptococcus zalophi]MBJ8349622.1 DEAD/DEAH box helicase [Streptococcus zalophi]MCR8968029.1 DEAD/DEAH box helicase [Streptococcus zalophi]
MIEQLPIVWQDKLKALSFETSTPIQEAIFKPIRNGKNVLAISPTGTGKTLAYLLPTLLNVKPKKGQQLLILAPNTELSGQLFDVAKNWAEPLGLTVQLFISGTSQKRQIERLKKGPEILIGTPGRIFELIKHKKIKMMAIDTIVLDEFDDLLSDSQYHFVNRITHHVPKTHQMIYVSATNSVDKDVLEKDTDIINLSQNVLNTITHYYLFLEKRERLEVLRKLANIPEFRGLVFFNKLSDLGASEEKLQFNHVRAISLASDVNTRFRKVILEKFKSNEISLLLGTDLLARGLDIDDLAYVINYDLPSSKESYIHRSGRTGRMGKSGIVITLITHKEELRQLKKWADVSEVTLKSQQLQSKS